ncbi:esterase, PHB depolymerase family [Duganella sp. CF402]|uniref:extracellular catalytic domain type 1 short-chain-length polyhydroxyalkanoate depolymerase n=1 Tax=unclassified Duganella TaxID=2636909 RepID=UPI0008CCE4C1|nr:MULTISPECIES: PHB depolymerase family esterase [unclassified Duganella]RZT05679.1 poly(hydroxyalkanoate) depolymerase family esterase [Duganella sp. BK701]SEM95067.1 esterase, PHB depolymerase family [Duganella sp. CF402]
MKLNILTQMREAAQQLLSKGIPLQRVFDRPAPAPAMRDINPPPPNAAPTEPPPAAAPQPPPQQQQQPNPATHPNEFAQDILNRMGIAIDLGSLLHPAPVAPPVDGAQFINGSYTNHAGTRNYKLYVPASYHGQAMPLLVMLHGCTQNPDDFAAGTQMNQLAEEVGFFVVYPEQNANANHSKCWNWFNEIDQKRGQGEPSIIAGIAQQIIDEYPVNERQVYVAGLSAGGAMAVIAGTLYPELFAAVGVHSGLPFASAQDLPSALSAMKRGVHRATKAGDPSQPIIVFHGDSDTTVHPVNGEQVMAQRLHHHRGARPSVQSGAVPDGYRYTQTTHIKPDGTPLGEHWVVHGAGHAWSGGSASGSYTDAKGPDASREMLRFFRTVS